MPPQPEWQQFFDHHAPVYLENSFTKNTLAEVDFILEVLQLPAGSAVMDVGCGVGRHALALAQRGFRMTGIDLSNGMLAEARKAANAAGLSVEWIQADASRFTAPRQFDAVICLCEGAFCLLSATDDPFEHDRAILKMVYDALIPGGRFLLTALNGMRYIRAYSSQDIEAGKFDPLTLTEAYVMDYDLPEGQGKGSIPVRERGYVPSELRLLFQISGFEVEAIWGGTAGRFARRRPEPDEMELMIVGRKI